MNRTDLVERPRLREDLPDFRPSDTVRVHVRVAEAGRERIQVFQGVVIRRQGGGLRETFTVRKISFGVGVERTFPLHSPTVSRIEVVSQTVICEVLVLQLRASWKEEDGSVAIPEPLWDFGAPRRLTASGGGRTLAPT